MDRLLDNDLAAKLVSVLLAVILWLQVARDVPETQRSIPGVPVQVRGLPPGLEAVEISPATVTVVARGRGRFFSDLTEEDFVAQVDLSGARAGRGAYRVDRVTVPKGVTLVGFAPEEVTVTLEPVVEKEVPVRVRLEGEPAGGFEAGKPEVVPATVVVRGRASLVAALGEAEVTVPLAGARETVALRRPVYLFDARGRPLAGARVTPEEVAVSVPVWASTSAREVPVRPAVTGEPAPGYAVVRVEAIPASVVVHGPDVADGGPAAVATEPVSVAGARGDVRRTVRLVAPGNARLDAVRQVQVVVRIAPAGGRGGP